VTVPSLGSPSGDHRVLEPVGATTARARRLDALAELWDGELRVEVAALVLDDDARRRWQARLGGSPDTLVASLLEVVAERGALDDEPGEGTLVGRIAAIGRSHPWPATPGERVAVPLPARVVPAFVLPGPWNGTSSVLPLRGHAIVPAGVATLLLGELGPAAAIDLVRVAAVPDALDAAVPSSGPVVVLGATDPAGLVAVAHLADHGRPAWAVTDRLDAARHLRQLDVAGVTVADLGDPVDSAAVVAAERGDGTATVVLADPRAATLAVRLGERVLDLAGDAASALRRHAQEAARTVEVITHHRPVPDRAARVHDLLASTPGLAAALRWGALDG
jgi:L-erythro-3,5-diaminohexanoate dehydrogenase